jgi:molecular chaperone DnaK
MSSSLDIETMLDRFRQWLGEVREEAGALPADAEAASAAGATQPLGLVELVAEFIALRHEVKLQTKSCRGVVEQTEQTLVAMRQAGELFRGVEAKEAEAARRSAKPLVESLMDLDEALVRGRAAIGAARRRIIEDLAGRVRAELDAVMLRLPWWRRWLVRRWRREANDIFSRRTAMIHRDIFEVVRIINEPTAASLAYDPHPEKMERLLVYDLGGGTFDVSIVQIEQGVVEVLSSHGDTHLGGDDFDQLLSDLVCDDFQHQHGVDLRQSPAARTRVLRAVEEAKKGLSLEPAAQIEEQFIAEKGGAPLHLRRELRRDAYEDLIEPLLAKTLKCVDEAVSDAKLNAKQIDKVVLVGGASRTPMVHRLLAEQLGQPIHAEVDPDRCVAMGAAIQGGLIAGIDVGPILVDITPHTLGIRALGEVAGRVSSDCFARLINRNSPLPASRSEMFGTVFDGQKSALIKVFQGEDDDVRHNECVGEFLLDGLAETGRGNEILVCFDLDLDGILKISAAERATGLQKQLTIDNAVSRFRARNRQEALARVQATYLSDKGTAPLAAAVAMPAPPPADLPAELVQLFNRCQRLIAKSGQLAEQANPADAADMRAVAEELRAALARRCQTDIEAAAAKLDDLVFYLQDA